MVCLGPEFDKNLDDGLGSQGLGQSNFGGFMAQFANLEYPVPIADPSEAAEDSACLLTVNLSQSWPWDWLGLLTQQFELQFDAAKTYCETSSLPDREFSSHT